MSTAGYPRTSRREMAGSHSRRHRFGADYQQCRFLCHLGRRHRFPAGSETEDGWRFPAFRLEGSHQACRTRHHLLALSAGCAAFSGRNVRRGAALELFNLEEDIGETLDLLENTYIFFMSDNGWRTSLPGSGDRSLDSNHPLLDGKSILYEAGIRFLFIVPGPGVRAGFVSQVPVTGPAILPTMAGWKLGMKYRGMPGVVSSL
jgi:hypothetical protein